MSDLEYNLGGLVWRFLDPMVVFGIEKMVVPSLIFCSYSYLLWLHFIYLHMALL